MPCLLQVLRVLQCVECKTSASAAMRGDYIFALQLLASHVFSHLIDIMTHLSIFIVQLFNATRLICDGSDHRFLSWLLTNTRARITEATADGEFISRHRDDSG